MQLQFDSNGNLPEDIILTPNEFVKKFGNNPAREKLISNLFKTAKKLHKAGGQEMHVAGSFISVKEFPNDIDVCFDTKLIDYTGFKEVHEEFFTRDGLRRMHNELKLHIFYNDMLDWFRRDKNGNSRGLVKILLKDLRDYDTE